MPYTPAASAPSADRPSTSSKPASTVSNSKKPTPAASGAGSNMSTARNRDVECHTCGGRGHFKRECPNKKFMLVNEDNEYETGDDADPYGSDDDDDAEVDAFPVTAQSIVVSDAVSTTWGGPIFTNSHGEWWI